MENPIAVYHKNCVDGTASAAVFLKRFPRARTFPLLHSYTEAEFAPILEAARGTDTVYLIDCALGFKELLEQGKRVVVLDHHVGIKDELMEAAREHKNLTYVFDNDKSGATVAWQYFFPDEEAPMLLRYVEDSDLWNGVYGDTTVAATLFLSMYTNTPEEVVVLMTGDTSSIIEKGLVLKRYVDAEIAKLKGVIGPIKFSIGDTLVAAYNIQAFHSPIGNQLAEEQGKAAVLFEIQGTTVRFSIRSKEGQSPSALDIARTLGGGGHVCAAGATIPLTDFLHMVQA